MSDAMAGESGWQEDDVAWIVDGEAKAAMAVAGQTVDSTST